VFPQSLWRHSHIRLRREQFEQARALIEGARQTSGPRNTMQVAAGSNPRLR
jgi:hypothetical protein